MRALAWFRSIVEPRYIAMLLETGQDTCYSVFDDGDLEIGIDKAYTVQTLGDYSGNSNIEVAHYAAGSISFTAPNTIACAVNGLVGWAVNDIMVIKGSTGNDGVVTVTGIGGAPANLTISAAANEPAAAMISLYKRTAHSNNAVDDDNTGLQWSRNTSIGEAVGSASNGAMNWYDLATVFTLHPLAADLQMITGTNTLRIVGGAGEVNHYHVGDLLDCAGFANAVNNLPGYYVVSVAVNGADLDIVFDPSNNTLVNEAAGGARSIGLQCRSIYNYAAGARSASLSNFTDWRAANAYELMSIMDFEAPSAYPDAIAFPVWPRGMWCSSTSPDFIVRAPAFDFLLATIARTAKTVASRIALVRLGT